MYEQSLVAFLRDRRRRQQGSQPAGLGWLLATTGQEQAPQQRVLQIGVVTQSSLEEQLQSRYQPQQLTRQQQQLWRQRRATHRSIQTNFFQAGEQRLDGFLGKFLLIGDVQALASQKTHGFLRLGFTQVLGPFCKTINLITFGDHDVNGQTHFQQAHQLVNPLTQTLPPLLEQPCVLTQQRWGVDDNHQTIQAFTRTVFAKEF